MVFCGCRGAPNGRVNSFAQCIPNLSQLERSSESGRLSEFLSQTQLPLISTSTCSIGLIDLKNSKSTQYHWIPSTVKDHLRPSNTIEYHQILSDTIEFYQILSNTIEGHRMPSNTIEYHPIPPNTIRWRYHLKSVCIPHCYIHLRSIERLLYFKKALWHWEIHHFLSLLIKWNCYQNVFTHIWQLDHWSYDRTLQSFQVLPFWLISNKLSWIQCTHYIEITILNW